MSFGQGSYISEQIKRAQASRCTLDKDNTSLGLGSVHTDRDGSGRYKTSSPSVCSFLGLGEVLPFSNVLISHRANNASLFTARH